MCYAPTPRENYLREVTTDTLAMINSNIIDVSKLTMRIVIFLF